MKIILIYIIAGFLLPCMPMLLWVNYSKWKDKRKAKNIFSDDMVAKEWEKLSKRLDEAELSEQQRAEELKRKWHEARNIMFGPPNL